VLLDQLPGLLRVFVFFEINDCDISALFGECDGINAADPALADCDERDILHCSQKNFAVGIKQLGIFCRKCANAFGSA
jgi:hypothetical protein